MHILIVINKWFIIKIWNEVNEKNFFREKYFIIVLKEFLKKLKFKNLIIMLKPNN